MTTTRLPAGFAGADPPEAWPPPRGRPRPDELERPVETLRGVGPSLARKLHKLHIRSIRDLVEHAPRDYQRPLGEQRIVDLFGEDEAAIAGIVRSVSSRRVRPRLTILKALVADPAVKAGSRPGRACACGGACAGASSR